MHYDGNTWSEMNTGINSAVLFLEAVRGSSSSDVFAAGSGGTLIHYDGTSWQKMEIDSDINFNDLWCPPGAGSGLDVFAAGEAGTIYHYTSEMLME